MSNSTSRFSLSNTFFPHESVLGITSVFQPRILISLLGSYLVLVRLLRYRIRSINDASISKDKCLSTMTVATAQVIVRRVSSQEFPAIFKSALQFALFRTYGIPTISHLLVDTSLFSEPASASQRYSDTTALVAEMMVRDIGSKAWVEGLARLNCIHGKYKVSGRISNDDFLYTLALFALEPAKFIDTYEWRTLTDVERCAIGVFWKTIGDAMEIEMKGLPTYDKGETWRDGLHWLNEIKQWADEYEKKSMVFDQGNALVAEQTTAILLFDVPQRFHPLGKQVVSVFMDKRLRNAMSFDDPPKSLTRYVHLAISIRKFCMIHLALPRPWRFRHKLVTDKRNSYGQYFLNEYDALPYYVKPTLFNRWNPGALIRRMRGMPVPGDDGDRYSPSGYKTVEIGPPHGKMGQTEAEKKVAPVGERRCPMAFA